MSSTGADTRARSRWACLNCRRKKVKCNGELPSCGFCSRLLQKCVYPSRKYTLTPDHANSNYSQRNFCKVMHLQTPKRTGGNLYDLSNLNLEDFLSSLNMYPPRNGVHDVSGTSKNGLQDNAHTTPRAPLELPKLPPTLILMETVDFYFEYCHNQPYCFFHEATFREQLVKNELPGYLIMAVLALASRFSSNPYYTNDHQIAASYASEAWKGIARQSFDSEATLSYRLVQAATLLAIDDFTGTFGPLSSFGVNVKLMYSACKHGTAWIKVGVAVSMAQALQLSIEPPAILPFAEQEERRRTFWSIYLLDRLATCGRHRPSLLLERTIRLPLPCSERSFQASTPEPVVTLESFQHLSDSQITALRSFAPAFALASILSEAAHCAFEHNKSGDQKAPWDHKSEYQVVSSRLSRFETYFEGYGDMQEWIVGSLKPQDRAAAQVSESCLFSYVIYHLCYCLLQHPFLLRHRLQKRGLRIPISFLAQAIASCLFHAQELTQTLSNAKRAGYRISASCLSYASMVAGSVHCLFQHSHDVPTRERATEALQETFTHMNEKARHWKNVGHMAETLAQFSEASDRFSALLDPSVQSVPLDPLDVERLYAVCEYGAVQVVTSHTPESADAGPGNTPFSGITQDAATQEHTCTSTREDYSGHIDGIIPQMFGHTDTETMLANFSYALQDRNEAEVPQAVPTWSF
ncbi:fungal-specific transcription factor domain-containing protein [Paraphoma chrysanthemicola]|uniref:Fungal-specific transcription factor domain-containing protein n=1 Tax=Paraphoma chrysanthemicola TaxID=798071 RepID=A0A8K0RAM1_9PLEO|nr:fungal-specific transcription factor domain-containing protein [Paraphoma chrysanthemicola]